METLAQVRRIVSVSLGASKRNATAELELGGKKFIVERLGTDGDLNRAKELLEDLDGKVDALGLGGTDLYVYAGGRRYTFRESAALVANVHLTPVLDGSGLKNTLERKVIEELARQKKINLKQAKVLLVCGVDRFGMAEALQEHGAQITLGDLVFSLGINKPLHSLHKLAFWAKLLAPFLTRLPVSWFYPMGKEQDKRVPKHPEYFLANDIIAGDFHYIKRFMPDKLPDKIIITNTVTSADREMLREAGVKLLVTTTPCLNGRSFGTNVMEALLVALEGGKKALPAEKYLELLEEYRIEASMETL